MTENVVDLQVDFPGKEYAHLEYDPATGRLALQEVVYPENDLPADLCSVRNTYTDEATMLPALLIRQVGLPPGCRVPARPIGLCLFMDDKAKRSIPLFVPTGDVAFAKITSLEDLPGADQNEIQNFLKGSEPESDHLVIQDSEAAWKVINSAQKMFRIQQTKQRKNRPAAPTWQPNSSPSLHRLSGEAERYTESEYNYWQLPRRFQKYIEEYLQPNERILSSLHRPVMRSVLNREFFTGKRLQESVLLVTDRQITLIEEKTPPGQSDVRYGYIATCCVPERLASVETVTLNPEVIGLRLGITASGGNQPITFEFPSFHRDQIEHISDLLSGWLPIQDDNRLRRATPVNIPEKLPPLSDPACNDMEAMKTDYQRYERLVLNILAADETVLDWCLLPGWLSSSGDARILAMTRSRMILLSENDARHPILDIQHRKIASMEFYSTYTDAHLSLFLPEDHRVQEESIRFSKTLTAMERFFYSLQQAIAIYA